MDGTMATVRQKGAVFEQKNSMDPFFRMKELDESSQ
jgi:hypothetical protein